ncbi:glycosyltransferase family 4 protein [Mucilaginibacter sp.]|jgi:glycosyltransferase involved in cell wall biosynthesis|uniref:glycosyltransferase family 4 protein n=1 Tax=Mucilaginibacter sp. TaxID=1882438 RepID=UPI00356327F6
MSKVKNLAIITTHPIQYYAPVFKLLQQRQHINIKVFYTWGQAAANKYDPGFGKNINWDLPLLDGYAYEWVNNKSADPGSHHFKGIVNPDLIQQVNSFKPTTILVFGWAYHSHLKAIRYFKNKLPVYFRGDSTLLDAQTNLRSTLKTVILKWVYRHIDHAFYVGTNNKAYFKKYGLNDSQLTFAPHAIDNDRFAASHNIEAEKLRNNLNIPAEAILILFAGKLEGKKAPSLLLKSVMSLNQPNLHLLFVGDGALQKQLKETSAANSNIHFVDFKNQLEMPAIYQACNLFCLPSKGPGESWGLAVNEAMACKKAILVSDKVGCAVDLVKENYNGSIFKSDDKGDLLKQLALLTKSKVLLEEYGENSGNMIKNWSFIKIAEAIENKLLHEKN